MEKRNVSENRKLFVGGLPWSVTSEELENLFKEGDQESRIEGCGADSVVEAAVVTDRDSGRSRGFGFVTVTSESKANEAIRKINGADYKGRNLKVDTADDKGGRSDRGSGGFKGRGGSRF